MSKLSAASIGTLPARKQPYRDHLVVGLCLHVGAKRRRWLVSYRDPSNKQKEHTIGYTVTVGLADARDQARTFLARVEAGVPATVQPVVHPKTDALTIGKLIDAYETMKRTKATEKAGQQNKRPRGLKSLPVMLRAVRNGLADYTDLPAKQFTKHDMRAAIAKIVDRGALQMADRTLNYAHTIFEWAARTDKVEYNPCPAVEPPGPGTVVRKRKLTDAELLAIWNATFTLPTEGGSSYGRLVRFLMIVPARINEARLALYGDFLGGRWRQDEDANKSGREFRLSLPDMALDILGQGTANERCFPKSASIGRYKIWLDEASGVSGWRHHDLRRTISSRLQDMGEPPYVISALLNHSAGRGADAHYLHGDAAKMKAEALERWQGELRKLLKLKATA